MVCNPGYQERTPQKSSEPFHALLAKARSADHEHASIRKKMPNSIGARKKRGKEDE